MQRRIPAVVIIVLLTLLVVPPALSSPPQQFNPGGAVVSRVDPYSGGNVTGAGGYVYYPLTSVFDPANRLLYTLQLYGDISVFDTVTNTTLPEINLGGVAENVVFDPLNGYLYVAALGSPYQNDPGHIIAINTTTDQIAANLTSISEPGGMAIDTANDRLFVGGIYEGTGIQAFDLASGAQIALINTTGSFQEATFNPANGNLYFLDGDGYQVVVVDGTTDAITGTISIGNEPAQAVFDPLNNDVYVTSFAYVFNSSIRSRVIGIDTSENVVMNTSLYAYPESVFVGPKSGLVFAAGYYYGGAEDNISEINPATGTMIASLNTSQVVQAAASDADNDLAYLVTSSESVAVVNTQNLALAEVYALFTAPEAIAYNAHDGTMDVYSVLDGSGESLLSVLAGGKLVGSVELGTTNDTFASVTVAVSTRTGLVYVAPGNDTIFVVNGTSSKIVGKIQVGFPASSIAYDSKDDTLFVLLDTEGAIYADNLNTGMRSLISLNSSISGMPVKMTYDQTHDQLIIAGTGTEGIVFVNGTNMQATRTQPLTLNGTSFLPWAVTYDPHDNLVYMAVGNPLPEYLLAISENTGQIVYYADSQGAQGLLYDSANGYVYTETGFGAYVFDGSVDLEVGSVGAGQIVNCMALDTASGYLYFGDADPGTVAIVQPGPGIPGVVNSTASGTVTVTTTETTAVTTTQTTVLASIVTSTSISTVTTQAQASTVTSKITTTLNSTVTATATATVAATATSTQTNTVSSTVTTTAQPSAQAPGGTPALELGLAAAVGVLAATTVALAVLFARRK